MEVCGILPIRHANTMLYLVGLWSGIVGNDADSFTPMPVLRLALCAVACIPA